MSFQIVHGYVCLTCSDVALAQKGINPAHPPNSPDATQSSSSNGGTSNTQSTPAVVFGGILSQTQGSSAVQPPSGAGKPASTAQPPPGQNGAQLSLYA